jgi:hypothetical protein
MASQGAKGAYGTQKGVQSNPIYTKSSRPAPGMLNGNLRLASGLQLVRMRLRSFEPPWSPKVLAQIVRPASRKIGSVSAGWISVVVKWRLSTWWCSMHDFEFS